MRGKPSPQGTASDQPTQVIPVPRDQGLGRGGPKAGMPLRQPDQFLVFGAGESALVPAWSMCHHSGPPWLRPCRYGHTSFPKGPDVNGAGDDWDRYEISFRGSIHEKWSD